MMNTLTTLAARFSRLAAATALGTASLVGCAVDAPDGEVSAEETSTTSEALKNNGGGPTNGFTCEGTMCTCSKGIEGDCDKMRQNCSSTAGLDTCINGWLTTDCNCAYRARTAPPRWTPPVGGTSSGGVFSP